MTWSIVARDESIGAFGVAIATCAFAVGALCPHARSGIGALSTQAWTNPLNGPRGLALLEEGHSAEETVARLVAADASSHRRQLHVVDGRGRTAAFTGSGCTGWCGHRCEAGISIAGNMLAGAAVLEATLGAYRAAADRPFAARLLAAMHAGEVAGGDKRGRQSAALRIHVDQPYPLLDLRVDDHTDPLDELERLYRVAHERYLPFQRALPASLEKAMDEPPEVDDPLLARI